MNSFIEALKLLFLFNYEIYGIILLTICVTICSVIIAGALALPIGVSIGSAEFAGKRLLVRVINTFMGLPPVVAGLVVYMLLSRSGTFGSLQLLFTPVAMIIAQGLIVFPIIAGLTIGAVAHKKDAVWETCIGLGLSKTKTLILLINECRYPIGSALLAGYGRAISEVGAVMLVGGNIQGHTRVMTTAIVLETSKGNYDRALAFGIILIFLSFLVNWVSQRLLARNKI